LSEQRNIEIKRLAINALNLQESGPKVSEEIFPLDESHGIIIDFFTTHFLETREGKSTKVVSLLMPMQQ
jgi:hypothetical protein